MEMIKQILLCTVILLLFSCQEKKNEVLNHEVIKAETDKIFEKLVEIRREFHEYPELAKEETRTQETIKKYLLDLGLQVKTDIYGKSVVGILRGSKEGKSIAWRADMDALPHNFPDEVEFKSKIKGVQHGCGHDVHMAIALGMAEVFSKYRHAINGNIYFIFQPEEETFVGAKKMLENGLFSSITPDEIYALHVTAVDVGQIMVKSNEIYAYQKRIQISFKNEISESEAISLYKEIRSLMMRKEVDSEPWNLQNVFDPDIGLSNQNTIFKDYCFMDENALIDIERDKLHIRANLYETKSTNLENILPKIEDKIKQSKHKDLFDSVSIIQGNPTVLNNDRLTKASIKTLSSIYGKSLISSDFGQIPYFNDDFSYFQQKVPGVYFLLGGSNPDKGIIALNHAPNFRVDEECIRIGVRSFSSLILERLNEKR